MSKAEKFREELKQGSPAALKAVKFAAQSSKDPQIQREAHEYLNKNKVRR